MSDWTSWQPRRVQPCHHKLVKKVIIFLSDLAFAYPVRSGYCEIAMMEERGIVGGSITRGVTSEAKRPVFGCCFRSEIGSDFGARALWEGLQFNTKSILL